MKLLGKACVRSCVQGVFVREIEDRHAGEGKY